MFAQVTAKVSGFLRQKCECRHKGGYIH